MREGGLDEWMKRESARASDRVKEKERAAMPGRVSPAPRASSLGKLVLASSPRPLLEELPVYEDEKPRKEKKRRSSPIARFFCGVVMAEIALAIFWPFASYLFISTRPCNHPDVLLSKRAPPTMVSR